MEIKHGNGRLEKCKKRWLGLVDVDAIPDNAILRQRSAADSLGTKILFKRASASEEPLYGLVKRLLPAQYYDHFVFKLKPDLVPASSTNVHDTFRISDGGNEKTVVEGATLAGLGAGLNYYIRNVCEVEMSWSGDRFHDMPVVPPTVVNSSGVIRASFVPWRYYMNVVTFGYSFVFWDWKRWERELGIQTLTPTGAMECIRLNEFSIVYWMTLNMALAMVGQENVFRKMYEDLGLTREELNGYFAGPTYAAWHRMGNLQGSWIISDDIQFKNDWIDSQWDLQKQIVRRMREFNITTTLPSFNGFQLIQTQKSIYQQSGLGFNNNSSHYYLLDLYNELHPVCMEVECLRQTTSGVMNALKQADPQAVWVMQSWFLIDREGFFGIDWGWSMLNNFGGGQGLYGTLPGLLTEPFKGYQQYPKWDVFPTTVGQQHPDPVHRASIDTLLLKRTDNPDAAIPPIPRESYLPLNVSSFRYDLVDVTREIMAGVVIPGLHKELVDAYEAKDLSRIRPWGDLILQAINDTGRILATHTHFMLWPWIRDARISAKRSSASNAEAPYNATEHVRYQDYLELGARNQITWWGPKGQQKLSDYAGKEWSGVVKGFYYPRWEIFVDRLVTAGAARSPVGLQCILGRFAEGQSQMAEADDLFGFDRW
ncbi:hypothetical protein BGZ65_012165 [Modicella reniformis]|uniref:Alpha-N-acetylglucosaminidase n=1 Tax=Modicella reniformis TaxID=1440133 RepID=A0A9P6MBZ6_9FUNG|nr:hypothetical protein BGZ65_012165 [Modicella reniformis]